jgi:hypothetical protein
LRHVRNRCSIGVGKSLTEDRNLLLMYANDAIAVEDLQATLDGSLRPWMLWIIDADGEIGRCEASGTGYLGGNGAPGDGDAFLMAASQDRAVRAFFQRARQEPAVARERIGQETYVLAGAPDASGGCLCIAVAMTAAEAAAHAASGDDGEGWAIEVSRPFPTYAMASEARVVVDPENPGAVEVVHTVPTVALPKAVRLAVRALLARDQPVTPCDGEGTAPPPHLHLLS